MKERLTPVDLLSTAEVPQIAARLASVIDPELGVNIVDLGLVYGIAVRDGVASVLLTTTTPACPIGRYLEDRIRRAVLDLDGVLDAEIALTHQPPWSPLMMSAAARRRLGWDR